MTLKEWLLLVLRWSVYGLLVFCLLSLAAAAAHCQTPDVQFVQQLKDASFVVRIGEVEHRCLNPNQMRDVLLEKAELEKSRELIVNLQEQIQLLTAERDALRRADKLADEQLTNLNERLAGFQKQLDSQTELLNKALALAQKSRLQRFLDAPYATLATKVILPLFTTIITGLK